MLTLAEIAKMKDPKGKTAFEKKLVKDIRLVLSMSGDRKRIDDGDYIDDGDIKRYFLKEHDYWQKQKLTEEEYDYAWDIVTDG